MRPVERIKPFLEKVDLENLLSKIWGIVVDEQELSKLISIINKNMESIKDFWEHSPDLRFSQVLLALNLIPNIPGFWYHKEESDILEKQGYSPEDINYWGVYFDKDMNRIKNPYYAPLSTLTTEHLKAILEGGFVDSNLEYQEIIEKILEDRSK